MVDCLNGSFGICIFIGLRLSFQMVVKGRTGKLSDFKQYS